MIAICAIAKCENSYLREWVEYHFDIGFDHIFLYDKNAPEGEHFDEVIGDLILSGRVTVVNVRGRRRHQLRAYRHYGRHFSADYQWTAYIDIDEFLAFTPESGYKSVGQFLDAASDFDVVHLNWLCYGDNGALYRTEGGVRERFTRSINPTDPINDHVKSIVKGDFCAKWHGNPHTPANRNISVCDESFKPIKNEPFRAATHHTAYIAHYFTKSLEEYVSSKLLRGGGNGGIHCMEMYYQCNAHTPEKSVLEARLLEGVELPHKRRSIFRR